MGALKIEGILPVLPTPFTDEGGVDHAAMRRVVRFCIDSGADAVVFPGVASEFDFLSADERTALLTAVCEEANGRVPVVSGASAETPEESAGYAAVAAELGAVAAMVLVPKRFADDEPGALRFIRSVAEQAPGVDIVLQNAPAPVGAGLAPDQIARIVSECRTVRYVKEEALPSGPRITAIRAAAPDHLVGVIGGGGARYLIDEMNRGAVAAMPAAEITDLHVKMWRAHRSGDEATARALYAQTLPLLVIQTIYRMRLTKTVLMRRGILENAAVRAPLPAFDSFDQAEIATQLEGLAPLFALAPVQSAA